MPSPPSTMSCSPCTALYKDVRQQSARSDTCSRITINPYLAFSSFAREGSWLASRRAAIPLNRLTVWTVRRQMSQGCKIAAFARVRRRAAGAQTTAAVCIRGTRQLGSLQKTTRSGNRPAYMQTCHDVCCGQGQRVSSSSQCRKAAQYSEA